MNELNFPVASSSVSAEERVSDFLRSVYGWMGAGLAVTAAVALMMAQSPSLMRAFVSNPVLRFGAVIAQFGVVFYLSARVHKLAPATAAGLFLFYSALTGMTFSILFLVYTGESIATTFIVTAGMFGAMAAYGTLTRRSLQGWGQFLFMGLIGLVIASLVNMFLRSDGVHFVLSFIGVIVFTGLTAYDAQRLKAMALALPSGGVESYAVVGALALYLDFINLFMSLLRFFGSRRD